MHGSGHAHAPGSGPVGAHHDDRDAVRLGAARLSLVVGVLMLAIKFTAWIITGSAGVLSDAMESVVHVVAVAFTYVAMRLVLAPPDENHPYGHGRIEPLAIGFEGGLVALAGLSIIGATLVKLVAGGYTVQHADWGAVGIGAAAVINLLLGWRLVSIGKKHNSPLLVGDGHHVLSDVWTSLAVLIGLGLVWLTGIMWIDAVVAVLAALYILWVGIRLVRSAMGAIMDEQDVGAVETVVGAINQGREAAWLDVHNLRLRRVGDLMHVDFHLMVPAAWTVERAHESVDRLEALILQALGARGGSVLVHLDHPHSDGSNDEWPAPGTPFTVASATRLKHDRSAGAM